MRASVPPHIFFLLPITIITTVFLTVPTIASIAYSFFRFEGLELKEFVGLQTYITALSDTRFQTSLINNLLYIAVTVPVLIWIPLFLALALSTITRGAKIFRGLIIVPAFISTIAASFVWVWIYSSSSPLQPLYTLMKMPAGLLSTFNLALYAVAFVPLWQAFGFYTLLYLSGLNSIDRAVFDSAKIDGAGSWGTFRYVILGMLKPTFAFVVTMSLIWNMQLFDHIYVMTRGGPGTTTYSMVFYIYNTVFSEVSLAKAYVMSVILLVIIASLAYVSIKHLGFGKPRWM